MGDVRAPTEMELMVAKALHQGWLPTWDQCFPDERARRISQARAAIRAMREPTKEMMGQMAVSDCADNRCRENSYQAMIDAASPTDVDETPKQA